MNKCSLYHDTKLQEHPSPIGHGVGTSEWEVAVNVYMLHLIYYITIKNFSTSMLFFSPVFLHNVFTVAIYFEDGL